MSRLRVGPMQSAGFSRLRDHGRRGVALVLAITMVALLMTFLIAAQTSVMGSIRLISRSKERMSDARMIDQALARAHQALNASAADAGDLEVGGQDAPPVAVHFERLAPGAEVFALLPGISGQRDGDALVAITLSEGSPPHQFLMNTQDRRSGVIRIQ